MIALAGKWLECLEESLNEKVFCVPANPKFQATTKYLPIG